MVLLCHIKLQKLKLYILRMDMKRNLSLAPEVVLVGLLNFLHSVGFLVHRALLYQRGGCERVKFNAQTHKCGSFWSVTHGSVLVCRLIVFLSRQLVNRNSESCVSQGQG